MVAAPLPPLHLHPSTNSNCPTRNSSPRSLPSPIYAISSLSRHRNDGAVEILSQDNMTLMIIFALLLPEENSTDNLLSILNLSSRISGHFYVMIVCEW
eukprot:scaffold2635_cov47-Cyclotella_meneghiniana.AAC.9